MPDRLIVDLSSGGQVAVQPWFEGELPAGPVAEPLQLHWPLDENALEHLRWYVEDYLRAPFGVYKQRGPTVAGELPTWGEAIFQAVFGSGPARDAYMQLRARGGAAPEIVFRSAEPALLGLPWELLRDPTRPTPLALDAVGITRSLPAGLGDSFAAAGERLRVLMVISRPEGTEDVGYRMIARPLLDRLEAVRGRVELVVLRPPTIDQLGRVLQRAKADGQPFQVVHFDGHGVLAPTPAPTNILGPLTFGPAGEGLLSFEKPEGGSDQVRASSVAQVLKAGEVPVVVLNACQSGAVGKELEAAVATRLLQEGVASVVAMAYAVYAVAAAEFMAAFYERLFAGDRVAVAVTAGRQRMHARNERPSPKGQMALEDWIVPVHYARRDVRFPYLVAEHERDLALEEALDDIRDRAGHEDGALDPVGSFVGRDALFFKLEVATRHRRAVVLHGPGGTGKTEVAKAFGRWWRDTGAVDRPEWVIFHSFEPGVASFGIDGVIAAIGLRVFGADFARIGDDDRRAAVQQILRERRLLLIWDNFESVHTMPDPTGATPPLGEEGREKLHDFVSHIAADGQSSLIITSRTEEAWLGDVRRIEVGGLVPDEAIEYADQLLAPYPQATKQRAKRTFGELLVWLEGHPLSMRLTLPHLESTDPKALLGALQGTTILPGLDAKGGRTTSLSASLAYSFGHLDPEAAQLLVAVSLFHGVADADVLGAMSQAEDVPSRFENVSTETWTNVLQAAADVGLLTGLGARMYRIHPALPSYLATLWRRSDESGYEAEYAATERALIKGCAQLGGWLEREFRTERAGSALVIVGLQRRTFGHLLGRAMEIGAWDDALQIVQPLDEYFDSRGLLEEARAWSERARAILEGSGDPPSLDSAGGHLWLFLVGSQANREAEAHQLESAEKTFKEILRMVEAQPVSDLQRARLAMTYHHLGAVAQRAQNLDAAEQWFERARVLKEELGNKRLTATTYHQLGMLAQMRRRPADAEDWYKKALALKEEVGDRASIASTYHQLGVVAYVDDRFDEAEEWATKALAIYEELGYRSHIAGGHHQLGIIALARGELEIAESHLTTSMTLEEQVGDVPGASMTFSMLGQVAIARGDLATGMEWKVRAITLFPSVPHTGADPVLQQLTSDVARFGIALLEDAWFRVTGEELPDAVRARVTEEND